VQAASLLHSLPGELLDVIIQAGGRTEGKRIRDIKMPAATIIATVLRDGEVVTATGDLMLQADDRVLIFCHPDAVKKIQSIFL
jgi:trk system potassium uptake protein TrkA